MSIAEEVARAAQLLLDKGRTEAKSLITPVFNVVGYGAKGDGVTDDTEAVRMAYDDAASVDGVVFFPPGRNFLIGGTLDMTKPVTMMGLDRSSTVLTFTQAEPIIANTSDVVWEGLTFRGVEGGSRFKRKSAGGNFGNWTFRNCTFELFKLIFERVGFVTYLGTTSESATDLSHDIKVIDCCAKDSIISEFIAMMGVTGGVVEGCHIEHIGIDIDAGDAVKIGGGSTDIRVLNNTIVNCTRDGIDAYDGGNITIMGNTLKGNGGLGIDSKWRTTDPNDTDFNRIVANVVEANSGSGINASVHRCLVIGNTVRGNGANGISITASVDSPPMPTEACVVQGNIVTGNTQNGIHASGAKYAAIIGNQCHGNAIGIATTTAASDCTFVGNSAFDNTSRGIQIYGDRHRVSDNQTQDVGGVRVEYSYANYVTTNGLGQETVTAGAKPSYNWPYGAIVRNTTDGKLWVYTPGDWIALN